ncbi:hypothetical protein C4D60_Mb08t23080 [Musa balbisiana]|uniref:Uncharacterized protein n=1 Tax=Musa balbisiana TaxID=52838 RepID=A0A4S8K5W2_MUSBA|nr:hypothetical protein C4D60_Mb08t23080 [Musa balbisiana]
MDGKNASDLIDKQNSFLREPKAGHLEHGNAIDEVPSSSSKQTKEIPEKVISEAMNSSINDAVSANDVKSTKVAELVNKNFVGFGGVGYLSTDQKKKPLWGVRHHITDFTVKILSPPVAGTSICSPSRSVRRSSIDSWEFLSFNCFTIMFLVVVGCEMQCGCKSDVAFVAMANCRM